MLNVFHSNKLEVLATELAALIQAEPLSGFAKEYILLESSAMEYWLTGKLTEQLGITANIEFPYPAAFIWQVYRALNPQLLKHSSFDRLPLSLRLYALFSQPDLPDALAIYLDKLGNEKHRLYFAEHLASLYDQYQIYRPQWLQKWQHGETRFAGDLAWQGDIWQRLCQQSYKDQQDPDRSSIFYRSLEALAKAEHLDLPYQRLHIFSLSSLAGSYLTLLEHVARFIEVNFYVLNPSQEFWLERVTKKTLQSSAPNQQQNDLLLLLAKQNQGFLQSLNDCENAQVHECFIALPAQNLLQHLQRDMTHFQQTAAAEKIALSTDDHSLQIHSCHHPLREVQVLHDQLLNLLDRQPDLRLEDIAIMVPDIDGYAPFIHAVFSASDAPPAMAYHISEKNNYSDQAVKRILIELLQLPKNQFRRSHILGLLEEPLIAEFFNFDDVDFIKQLFDELNVRFGLDDNTWQQWGDDVLSLSLEQAKARLLKSFAFGDVGNDNSGIDCSVSYELINGIQDSHADSCGSLIGFIDVLNLLNQQQHSQTIEHWCEYIRRVLKWFFTFEEDNLYALQQIDDVLVHLVDAGILSIKSQTINFDIFYHLFEQQLQSASQQQRFKPNAINIASLLPMRSLPFDVICVLGLNDGDFPQSKSQDALDLMQRYPEYGDRNHLEEERYLFLQSLISAKRHLYLSYIGRSVIDNSQRYPSLLLAELLSFIDKSYTIKGVKASEYLVTQHALQAFDSRYFMDDSKQENQAYFTYQNRYYQQAKKRHDMLDKNRSLTPFFTQALTVEPKLQYRFEEWCHYLSKPSSAFLGQLTVRFNNEFEECNDAEIFNVDGLASFILLQQIFDQQIGIANTVDSRQWVLQGLLPQSVFAGICLEEITKNSRHLYEQYLGLGLCCKQSVNSHYHIAGVTINTTLKRLNIKGGEPVQAVAIVAKKLRGKHFLNAWLQHVLLNTRRPCETYIFSQKAVYCLEVMTVDDALTQAEHLLEKAQQYQQQLSWFFVDSAWEYIQIWAKASDEDKAWAAYKKKLYGDSHSSSELAHDDNALLYRNTTLDERAMKSEAKSIFGPMMDYLKKIDTKTLLKAASKEVNQ